MSIRRAALWSVSSQYVSFAAQFVASVIISRWFLLPADVGLFSIALAAAMVLSIFQDMGVTRFISGQPAMDERLIGAYSAVSVAIGWLVALAVMASGPVIARFYGEPRLFGLVEIIGASFLLVPFAMVSAALLIRRMDFRGLFWVNAGGAVAGNGLAIALARGGCGAASLAWGVIATALVRALVAQALAPARPTMRFARESVQPMLAFSWHSFVINLSAAVGMRSQDLIVGRLLGAAATGLFSRSTALAGQLSTLVTGAVNGVFYAAFARKRDRGEPLAEPYLHLIACNTAVNWAALGGLALAAEPVVLLLYGPRWGTVAPLLRWTALGELFFIAIPLQMDVPILLGRIRTLIWVNWFETGLAVLILTTFAWFGLHAAALSRVVYGFAWWIVYVVFQQRLLGFRWRELIAIYAKSALCAAAAGLPLWLFGPLHGAPDAAALARIAGLSGIGVICWLAALALLRHPAWDEVRGAARSLPLPGPLRRGLAR